MTTDWQVRLLMSLLKEGTPLVTAAAKAGMSEPTARKYRRVKKLPSELRPVRTWRTREDSLGEVWPDVERMLELDGGLEAKTVFEELQRRHPGRFTAGQLRTLQRRFRQWRALHGPSKEVIFPQVREPGVQCQSDFTDMRQLSVTIGGEPLAHLCFHGGRVFNERYLEVLQHYGIEASKNTPGNTHENGDVESAHRHFKRAVDQRLRLRGMRDFASLEQYEAFLHQVVAARNAQPQERLTEELAVMRPLPVRPLPAWREDFATLTRWSTVRVARKAYSAPSRLIGERLRARVFAAHIKLWRGADRVGVYRRLRGEEPYRTLTTA